jgi:hypothetical protein
MWRGSSKGDDDVGYRNSGVMAPYNATKKKFKEGAMTAPELVKLYATSPFSDYPTAPVSELEEGLYTVVGPDPSTKRSWYATLEIATKDGQRKVKVT